MREVNKKIQPLPIDEALAKCRLVLCIMATEGTEINTPKPAICSLCNEQFHTRFNSAQHLKCNIDCTLQYKVGEFSPLKCHNANCNECCAIDTDLQKHILCHFHLTHGGKTSLISQKPTTI